MIQIRNVRPEDRAQVRKINELAFETPAEANIVETIHRSCTNILSLVAATDNGMPVGHAFFSPAVIESGETKIEGMGLAPVAVLPGRQKEGIGSQLIREGLRILRDNGCFFVIVLGHPDYYPRFGFKTASDYGISSEWPGVPDNAFMIHLLDTPASNLISGVAKYREEFNL